MCGSRNLRIGLESTKSQPTYLRHVHLKQVQSFDTIDMPLKK
jgi:hypothetical protein